MDILERIQQDADRYFASLQSFTEEHGIQNLVATAPDHCAIKCKDTLDFEETIATLRPHWQQASYTPMHNRRLATVILKTRITIGSLGQTTFLEVMEPRPEKVGKDLVGFEHIELLNENFASITEQLVKHDVDYEPYTNPNHQAIVVRINNAGQEIKFTNKSLSSILEEEQKDNHLTFF